MSNIETVQLRFGPYATPQFKYGDVVMDEMRGEVTVVGIKDSPIPWPIGKRGRHKSLVLYADLIKAVERESGKAICHWWDVSYTTVTTWRKVLGVERANDGTRLAFQENARGEAGKKARAAGYATHWSPERIAKIAAANRNRKLSKSTIEKMRLANIGRKRTQESIDKQVATRRRNNSVSAHGGRPCTESEDDLLPKMSVKEFSARTGRTVAAVYHRRKQIGLAKPRKPKS